MLFALWEAFLFEPWHVSSAGNGHVSAHGEAKMGTFAP